MAATKPIPAVSWRSVLHDTAVSVRRFCHQYLRPAPSDEPAIGVPAHDVPPGGFSPPAGVSVIAQVVVNNGATGGMAASPDGRRLVVTNRGDNSVSIIDTGICAVANTIRGISEPFAIGVGNHNCVYVSTASASYDAITAIDLTANVVAATHPVARNITDVAVSPDGNHVYASRTGSSGADVAVLETTTGRIDAIDIARAPGTTTQCLRISPNGQRLYVASQRRSGGELIAIDAAARTVIDIIEIGSSIRDIALSPDGGTAYVASCDPNFGGLINLIDTRTHMVTRRLKIAEIGGFVTQLTLTGDGERAYLVSGNGVVVLCALTLDILGTITVGAQPSCVVESRSGHYLYVADYSGAITAVSAGPNGVSSVNRATDDETTGMHQLPQLVMRAT
jgi:YVTN family beta-propeller protein